MGARLVALKEVSLEQDDWNRVLACLSEIPWKIANPLIMAIGEQLRAQGQRPNGAGDVAPQEEKRQ